MILNGKGDLTDSGLNGCSLVSILPQSNLDGYKKKNCSYIYIYIYKLILTGVMSCYFLVDLPQPHSTIGEWERGGGGGGEGGGDRHVITQPNTYFVIISHCNRILRINYMYKSLYKNV